MEYKTVGEHFRGYFEGSYDGSYHTARAEAARADFLRLTDLNLNWTQVHGDFKDAAKRALFEPYRYWPELHEACRAAIKSHSELETQYVGAETCARIMRDAMTILRARNGVNVPRWWLPMMDQLRGRDHKTEKQKGSSAKVELKNGVVLCHKG